MFSSMKKYNAMEKSINLSVVIPCYNSEATLAEAVESCFTQGLDSFEIVMVDDGSQDGTRDLMESLARKRAEIRTVYHSQNKGGGAARNTGIAAARGRLIYCLDSDNVLDAGSLRKLTDYLDRKGADGVSFHERRFFSGNNLGHYSPLVANVLDRPITLADLFTEPAVLLDNFLFTKESFLRTQGFPEHHGFDTQGYEMRYLKPGNRVFVCPDSAFYHRQLAKGESYFEREYNKGNFSLFYYLSVEDIFELLHPKAQEFVAKYDVFRNSTLENNLLKELKALHAEEKLFSTIADAVARGPIASFADGVRLYRAGEYAEARRGFETAIEGGLAFPVVYYDSARCAVALSGVERRLVERETAKGSDMFRTEPRRLYRKLDRMPFARSARIIINTFKKWLTI